MIKEVEMLADSIKELKKFYLGTLGLTLIKENLTSFSVKVGGSIISFKESEKSIRPLYHFAINIPENKIDDALKWVKDKVSIIPYKDSPIIHFKDWNAHSIYFYDPAGNIIELIARHNLNNKSNQIFSQESLLCLSEIGLPVSDVNHAINQLSDAGIFPWQESSSNFAPLGDEEGLLILVRKGRVWFMSSEPAYPYDLTINTEVFQITLDELNGMNVIMK